MSSKSAPPLPLPLPDYELINEQITRRTIEQLFQDMFSEIDGLERLNTASTSKAVKRHQFLLMGVKGNV